MHRVFMQAIAISSMVTGFGGGSATPPVLSPSNKWHVYYLADRCLLSRDYGTADTAQTLAFRPVPLTGVVEVRLVSDSASKHEYRGEAVMTFQPSGTVTKGYTEQHPASRTARHVTDFIMDDAILASLTDAATLQIAVPKEPMVQFAITGGEGAVAAVRKCTDALLEKNGVNLREQARVVTEPQKLPDKTVPDPEAGYPTAALQRLLDGDVDVLYSVDTTGKIGNCRILASSDPVFEAPSCAMVQKMKRFSGPALDKDGKPVLWYHAQTVRWRMPYMSPEFLEQLRQANQDRYNTPSATVPLTPFLGPLPR